MDISTAPAAPAAPAADMPPNLPDDSPGSTSPMQSMSPPLVLEDTAKLRHGYADKDHDSGIGERSEAVANCCSDKEEEQQHVSNLGHEPGDRMTKSTERTSNQGGAELADNLRISLHVGDLILEKTDLLMTSTRTGDTSATTRDSHDTLADSNHHEQPRSSEDEDYRDNVDKNERYGKNQTSVSSAPVQPAKGTSTPSAGAPFTRSRTRDSAMSGSRHTRQSNGNNSRTKTRMPPRDGKKTHWHPSAAAITGSRTTGTAGPQGRDQVKHNRRLRNSSKRKNNSASDGADDLCSKPGEIDVIHDVNLDEDYDDEGSTGFATSRSQRSHASSATPVPRLTEDRINSFIKDYYEDFDSIFQTGSTIKAKKAAFEAFFDQYYTKDVLWIRSSGNPIGRAGLADMLCDDIDISSATLVSTDSIQLLAGGLAATVVYTADLKFCFKGQPQSDRTVLTSVLQVTESGEILIAHVHWSVGKPIPVESRWQSEN